MKSTFVAAASLGVASAIPEMSVPKFTSGFLHQFVGEVNTEYIQTCAHDVSPMAKDIEQAVLDILTGRYGPAAGALVDAVN